MAPLQVTVVFVDTPGTLAKFTQVCTERNINLSRIHASTQTSDGNCEFIAIFRPDLDAFQLRASFAERLREVFGPRLIRLFWSD